MKDNSTRWDGKETEVPGRTVVRLGSRGVDGLEKAEVHWGKGKGKKVWKCVMLEGGEEEEEARSCAAPTPALAPATRHLPARQNRKAPLCQHAARARATGRAWVAKKGLAGDEGERARAAGIDGRRAK